MSSSAMRSSTSISLAAAEKLRAAGRIVLRFDFEQLFLDNLTHEVLVGKDALEVIDLLFEFLQLSLELVTLQNQ